MDLRPSGPGLPRNPRTRGAIVLKSLYHTSILGRAPSFGPYLGSELLRVANSLKVKGPPEHSVALRHRPSCRLGCVVPLDLGHRPSGPLHYNHATLPATHLPYHDTLPSIHPITLPHSGNGASNRTSHSRSHRRSHSRIFLGYSSRIRFSGQCCVSLTLLQFGSRPRRQPYLTFKALELERPYCQHGRLSLRQLNANRCSIPGTQASTETYESDLPLSEHRRSFHLLRTVYTRIWGTDEC